MEGGCTQLNYLTRPLAAPTGLDMGVSFPCSHSYAVEGGCTRDGIRAALLCLRQNRSTLITCAQLNYLTRPLAAPTGLDKGLSLAILRKKNPPGGRVFYVLEGSDRHQLLDFSFLVHDVLANDGIILLEFEFARRIRLVLDRRVEMPGTGTRLELDLLALAFLGHRLLPRLYWEIC